jgi:anti-sigma factor RsiW
MDVNSDMMKDKALALLIHSLDNELNSQEQEQLDAYLAASEALGREKELLLEMRSGLATLKVGPDKGFADQIIRQINASEQKAQNPDLQVFIMNLFPKVAAACVIVLVVAVLATFLMEGNLSMEAFIGLQDLSPEDAYTLLDY